MVASSRARLPFTHFLSTPLATPAVQGALLRLQEEVVAGVPGCRGLHPSLFQAPALLHLTLGTLALMDEREEQLAAEVLEECGDLLLRPLLSSTSLTLAGLQYMNDDPSEVSSPWRPAPRWTCCTAG